MAVSDMPNVPAQNVPAIIAQANSARTGNVATTRAIGVCAPSPSNNYSLENVIEPIGEAKVYLQLFEHRTVTGAAAVTVLQQPRHGVLRMITEADRGTLFDSGAGPLKPDAGLYAYLPEQGYLGKDAATILVDFGGVKVQVKYYFQAVEGPLGSYWDEQWCSNTGVYWKISSTLDPNGTSTITSVEYQSPTTTNAAGSVSTTASGFTVASSYPLPLK